MNITFIELAYAMASMQALVICLAFLFWQRTISPKHPRRLALIFFLISLWGADRAATGLGLFHIHPHFGLIGFTFSYAIPGLCYVYFRDTITQRTPQPWVDLFHATPFLVTGYTVLNAYQLHSVTDKIAFWEGGFRSSAIFDPIISAYVYSVIMLQIFLMVKLGYQQQSALLKTGYTSQHHNLSYLQILGLAFFTTVAMDVARRYFLLQEDSSYLLQIDSVIAAWVYLLITFLIIFLIIGKEKQLIQNDEKARVVYLKAFKATEATDESTHDDTEPNKHWEYLEAHLTMYMEKKMPYLNTSLTLSKLARKLGVPARELSSFINVNNSCNFSDYIADWRVNHFKQLCEKELKHINISYFMHASGFSSKSTFITHFKKRTGMTPSQWCDNLKKKPQTDK